MKFKIKIFASLMMLLGLSCNQLLAQDVENLSQYRAGIEMDWKLFNVKGLKMSVEPQLRFEDGFDSFVINTGIQYKTFGFLYWGAVYRLTFEPADFMETNNYAKYNLYVNAKEDFGRFTPSLRVLYSNYTNDDTSDKSYLRYRAKLKYNIRKCPITPYASAEAYQELTDNELTRIRYGAGADLKLAKGCYLNMDYKLDYYTQKFKNRHIVSVGLKLNL